MELLRFSGINGRMVEIHKTFQIDRPLDQVFAFWVDFEKLPNALDRVYRVEDLGRGRLRWTTEGPAGIPITWDAAITRLETNQRIAWRTVPGSPVAGAGFMRFEPIDHQATRVDLQMAYNPPGGVTSNTSESKPAYAANRRK